MQLCLSVPLLEYLMMFDFASIDNSAIRTAFLSVERDLTISLEEVMEDCSIEVHGVDASEHVFVESSTEHSM